MSADRPAHLDRWPMDFETWPRADQILKAETRYSRAWFLAEIFAVLGHDTTRDEFRQDTKLDKRELAAIKLGLEGKSFKSAVADRTKRRGLLEEILCLINFRTRESVSSDDFLTTKELAAIWLTLEGIDHGK